MLYSFKTMTTYRRHGKKEKRWTVRSVRRMSRQSLMGTSPMGVRNVRKLGEIEDVCVGDLPIVFLTKG